MSIVRKTSLVITVALALSLASAGSAQGLWHASKARIAAKLKNNPLTHKAVTLGLSALLLMPIVPSEVLAKDIARLHVQAETNVQQVAGKVNQDTSAVLRDVAHKLEDVVAIASIDSPEDVEPKIPDRNKVLILASIFGNLDVIKALVSTGIQDVYGFGLRDAFIKSAYYGHKDVSQYLISITHPHTQANRQEAQLSSERVARANALIEDSIGNFYATDESYDPISARHQAFRHALDFGDLSVIKLMFDRNDEGVQDLYDVFYGVHTTMKWAARDGHLDIVKYAWEQGAGSDEVDKYFRRASMGYAAQYGHLDVVKYLHSVGVHPLVGLEDAVDGGQLDTIEYLLEAVLQEGGISSDYAKNILVRALRIVMKEAK